MRNLNKIVLALTMSGTLISCSGAGKSANSSLTATSANVATGINGLPSIPTRDQVLSVEITFQGLTVQTQQYGALPWFEAALVSLNPADRQAVYAAKHAAGDTHCIVSYQWSYNEPGQPYNDIPGRDFTNDNQSFAAMIEEVIRAGFIPLIFMGGDADYNEAVKELPNIVSALKSTASGDLNPYVVYIPGWDGVFYGYTPDQVANFGKLFRSLLPNGYLGIEHNTGHIPVGNGPQDWAPNDMMGTYDVVFSEFNGWVPGRGGASALDDSVWQVAARLIGPDYKRPSDQPAGDDVNAPFYLKTGNPRGPYYAVAFEYDEYRWVRGMVTADEVNQERKYFTKIGFKYGDLGAKTATYNPTSLTFNAGGLALNGGHGVQIQGYSLNVQGDGNLVIYDNSGHPIWAPSISGSLPGCGSQCSLIFQGDGNLVLYSSGHAYWSTGTVGAGVSLVFQATSPYLKIVNGSGGTVWSSDGSNPAPVPTPTVPAPAPSPAPAPAPAPSFPSGVHQSFSAGGFNLTGGQSVQVLGYSLNLQGDGNLVVYDISGHPVWAPSLPVLPNCGTGCSLSFQGDGNLVLYSNGQPYWASNTQGQGSTLIFQSTAPYVGILNASGTVVWTAANSSGGAIPIPAAPPVIQSSHLKVLVSDIPGSRGIVASVTVGSKTLTSDAGGYADFGNLPNGNYVVTVTANGWQSVTGNYNLTSSNVLSVRLAPTR